jgi:hypothetical protein
MAYNKEPEQRSRYSDWLRAGRPRGRSSSPGRVKTFLHVVQTGSVVHPASCLMGTGGSFPPSADVKKMSIHTPIPPYVFMA